MAGGRTAWGFDGSSKAWHFTVLPFFFFTACSFVDTLDRTGVLYCLLAAAGAGRRPGAAPLGLCTPGGCFGHGG